MSRANDDAELANALAYAYEHATWVACISYLIETYGKGGLIAVYDLERLRKALYEQVKEDVNDGA